MIIDTFHANYFVPKSNADPFALKKRFDNIATNLLGQEIEPLLARTHRDSSILVFINKLSVHLVLKPAKMDDRTASKLWAQRLIATVSKIVQSMPFSITAAGAVGKETGSNVALFQNQAAYLAHFINDLMGTGEPAEEVLNKWYYYQFRELSSFSPSQIVKALCKQNRKIIEAVFSKLDQMGSTENILRSITEEDAGFLYSLFQDESLEAAKTKQIDHYEQVIGFIIGIIQKGLISSDFICSCTRSYKLCLKIFMLFLNHQKKYPALRSHSAVKEAIRQIVFESPGSLPFFPDTGITKIDEERGIQKTKTAYGGLFLLISVLREMHLLDILRASQLPDKDNISAINTVLFFTASAIVRQNQDLASHPYIDAADPGFFIFAGMEPSTTTQYLEAYPGTVTTVACEKFLKSVPSETSMTIKREDIDYETVISTLSEYIFKLFARRLKGFETSSIAYLFEHFIHRFSEIRWNRRSIRVILFPKPLDTVLRMSGLLEEIGKVPWLKNRNVTFQFRRE